jgi:hypothetical protein
VQREAIIRKELQILKEQWIEILGCVTTPDNPDHTDHADRARHV